ncbi:hypothetical protein [Ideonella sp.]|uniref:hypothetical protein n=1 Tax=Ideonella sp. TaxID=1929293 RepID=UPI002B47334A|nr:hypothetical protein [Ideonella sp.]HJV68970.1 hypothetical protein [Ideonella sp.]
MRKGLWRRTCARVVGAATLAATMLLGACGGGGGGEGGGNEPPPTEYGRVSAVVGETYHWTPEFTMISGRTFSKVWRDEVTSVQPDGAYVEEHTVVDYSSEPISRNTYDSAGRQLTYEFDWTSSFPDICTYTPAYEAFKYPLHIGKTWTSDVISACSSNNKERLVETRTVEALERITVPAGTFDTLRIRIEASYSDAGTGWPPSTPYTSVSTCWWSIQLGRVVKCDTNYQYPQDSPTSNVSHSSQALISYSR